MAQGVFNLKPHNEREFLDVFQAKIIPKLQLRDLQALGQVQQALRRFIHTALPGAAWLQLAQASPSFATGHPLFAQGKDQILPELKRLAALHHSISSSTAASSDITLWEGPSSRSGAGCLTTSPSGQRAITAHGDRICLAHLDLSRGAIVPCQELWSIQVSTMLWPMLALASNADTPEDD